jgi:hypothetical protein
MANPDKIFPLICQPGIQRDGTQFDSSNYLDGQWCRFYQGRPQKMGGYNKMIGWDTNIPRGIFVLPDAPLFNVYIGDSNSLKYFPADNNTGLSVGPFVPRTPASIVASPYNVWSFDTMFSSTDNGGILIAMATQNLYAIDQVVESPIFYGETLANTPLIETGLYTSGGFVVLHPYLFIFGNNGSIRYTAANDPTTVLNETRVTGSKIVAGFTTRGGNSSPAGLFFSLDSVIRATQVGTDTIEFKFDTITSESSILSSRGVVEYDGIYYWAGVDRFLFYNGVVQELPNSMNLQYFFNNLNYAQRQKVWATKYTKYGEIWWHYPSGNNTECDKAIIYNVREKVWYDTNSARSCGYFSQTFTRPIWADTTTTTGQYLIWRHGSGTDQVIDNVSSAINSYFEMSVISWVADGPGGQNIATDKTVYLYRLEPDFIQSGTLSLTVKGKAYASSPDETGPPVAYTFSKDPLSPNFKEKIDLREQRRLMTLTFDSNEVGGYYQMGKCLLVPRMGDTKP